MAAQVSELESVEIRIAIDADSFQKVDSCYDNVVKSCILRL